MEPLCRQSAEGLFYLPPPTILRMGKVECTIVLHSRLLESRQKNSASHPMQSGLRRKKLLYHFFKPQSWMPEQKTPTC
jgi:hypothetical protein